MSRPEELTRSSPDAPPSADPLIVLQSVKPPTAQTNPYIVQLVRALSDQLEVHYFSWRTGLLGRYHVFHLHWPEVMLRRKGRPQRWAAMGRFALLMLRLSVQRRIAVVRTVHNVGAHESGGRLERLLLAWCDRRTDHWIALNEQTRPPREGPLTVILHGDYRGWFESYQQPPSISGQILYFGLIRPYKGIDALLAAFAATTDPSLRLRIVGRPVTGQLRAQVQDAVQADERISAVLDYVDDETLATEVGQAELVVLPYQDIHNSGALLLALSLDRPALVPRAPVTVALAAEVGNAWVPTYSGPLTAEALSEARAALPSGDGAGRPDLSRRGWPLIAGQHAALYRSLRS
jgi:beta-1,4-mannosyltransferase